MHGDPIAVCHQPSSGSAKQQRSQKASTHHRLQAVKYAAHSCMRYSHVACRAAGCCLPALRPAILSNTSNSNTYTYLTKYIRLAQAISAHHHQLPQTTFPSCKMTCSSTAGKLKAPCTDTGYHGSRFGPSSGKQSCAPSRDASQTSIHADATRHGQLQRGLAHTADTQEADQNAKATEAIHSTERLFPDTAEGHMAMVRSPVSLGHVLSLSTT